MRRFWMMVLIAGLGVGLAACGSGGTKTVTETVSDASDATESPSATEDNDCESLGINFKEQNEGECVEDGETLRVVNRDSTLQLPELSARMVDIDLTDSVGGDYTSEAADGTFAVFTLAIKNKMHAPMEFDSLQEQVSLSVINDVYTEDFDAENGPLESSFLWMGESIQPQATQTGSVVFDLPKNIARKVETDGNLLILNFSDADSYGESHKLPLGIIRTYPPRS